MYAVGGGGDIDQVNGDQDGTAVKPPKPDKGKGKGKVWDKVAWFSKKSKHKYSGNHRSYSSEAHAEPSTSSLSPDGIDIDLSPASTFDSSYPSHIWMDSSSSSDSDLFEMQDGCCVKRSKLYPNSEVIEQNCLKPSVARALFLQLEASNLRNGSESKRSWLKKKKKINYRPNNSCEDSNFEEPVLRGAVSMPGGIKETSNCHCTACCSCSPSRRFNGGCRAYSRRRTSVSSLDTGLTNLDFDFECPGAGSSDMSGTGSEESMLPVSGHVNSLPQGNGDINKSNSLPTYYSQSLQKKCKACGKLIRISHLMCDSNKHVIPNPPFMESLTADFCKCRSQMKEQEGQCTRKVSVPTTSRPANIVPNQELKPKEFKDKFDLMKEWFREFNDEQKNLVLKEMVNQSQVPQIHLLSVEMKHKMHTGCPDNCEDNITWLPRSLSLLIFSYLDPVSLCRASQMSRQWYEMSTESSLWRNFCYQPKWKLSRTGEQKQLINHMMANGDVNWKRVFAEKYKLRNNWLKGKCNVRTFEGHTQGISCVQFDDTRIVSGSSDKTIKVWNIRTNSPWAVQTLVGHSGTVRCLHLDGNRLVSGSTDKTIKVWDLSTQQSWSSIACKVTMIGHLDTVRCLQVDDDKVISGSYDKTLKIWDVRKGVCKQSLRGHDAAVLCVQFDNNKIVSGSCDKTIKIWNFDGDCVMSLTAHHDAVTCLQFDDTRIVSGSLDSTLKFWDVHTGQCLNTIDWKASEGHTGVVRCLQADSWRVVSASDDRTLKVWSLDTCQRLVTLRNHTDGVTCLQFNDSIIVSGSYDKTVKLWDFSCC